MGYQPTLHFPFQSTGLGSTKGASSFSLTSGGLHMPVRLSAACIAECIGSFMLTFIGIMAISAASSGAPGAALLTIAIAHGLALAIAVTATWSVSGGHINPAITVGFVA